MYAIKGVNKTTHQRAFFCSDAIRKPLISACDKHHVLKRFFFQLDMYLDYWRSTVTDTMSLTNDFTINYYPPQSAKIRFTL